MRNTTKGAIHKPDCHGVSCVLLLLPLLIGSTITVTDWPGDIFAEGYHVPHHLRAAEHYTLCRTHYTTDHKFYMQHNCIVLHGSDPLSLWINLLLSNWGYFSARLEDFSGQMTDAQKRAFCRYRTRPLGSKPANYLEASAVALAAAAQQAAVKELAAAAAAAEGKKQTKTTRAAGGARKQAGSAGTQKKLVVVEAI